MGRGTRNYHVFGCHAESVGRVGKGSGSRHGHGRLPFALRGTSLSALIPRSRRDVTVLLVAFALRAPSRPPMSLFETKKTG